MTQLPAMLGDSMAVFECGWLSSNNVLFADADRATLVDTGYVSHAPQTLALVRQALGTRRLDAIGQHASAFGSLRRQRAAPANLRVRHG